MTDDAIRAFKRSMDSLGEDFRNQAKTLLEIQDQLGHVKNMLELICAAFPDAANGGMLSHRLWHELANKECLTEEHKQALVEIMKRRDFWADVMRSATKGTVTLGAWAAILFLLGLIAAGVLAWLKQHLGIAK